MTNPIPLLLLPQLPDFADLSRASGSWLATIGVGLAVGLPGAAAADPLDTEAQPRPAWTRWLDPNAERPPVGENVFYKKGAGLEYRQEAKFGDSPVVMGVQGPLLKSKKDPSPFADPNARQKRLSGVGVTFELRF
jgi:hypothetical protein